MTLEERFWSKVEKTNGCWIWKSCKSHNGYGLFKVSPKMMRAHRVSWEMANGSIPDGMQVNHTCDNPACVNPFHLYAGTQKQNREDAVARGRTAKGSKSGSYTHPESRRTGEDNGNSKLTNAQRDEVRRSYLAKEANMPQLGKKYNVTRQSIWYIVHYKGA